GNPEPRLLALYHQLQPFGPSRDDVRERERRRLTVCDRAVEHLAVRRPAGVVDGDRAVRFWVPAADAFLDDLVGEAARRRLCINRGRLDVCGRAVRNLEELDIKD